MNLQAGEKADESSAQGSKIDRLVINFNFY